MNDQEPIHKESRGLQPIREPLLKVLENWLEGSDERGDHATSIMLNWTINNIQRNDVEPPKSNEDAFIEAFIEP